MNNSGPAPQNDDLESEEVNQLLDELGFRRVKLNASPTDAPPVDTERIRALIQHQLSEEESREMYRLLATSSEWRKACGELLREQLKNKGDSTNG